MISKFFDWFDSAAHDDLTLTDWAMGLVLILIVSLGWRTVVNLILEA